MSNAVAPRREPHRGFARLGPIVVAGLALLGTVALILFDEPPGTSSVLRTASAHDLLPVDPGMIATGPLNPLVLKQEETATPPVPSPPTPAPPTIVTPPQDTGGEVPAEGASPRGQRGGAAGDSAEKPEAARKKPPQPGIPVKSDLVIEKCSPCHERDGRDHLTRISYLRKSPEMWELSLKRMIRLNGVVLEPDEAKQIVRYLANDHGLTREEAEQALYETERRIHWSEETETEDLRETCAKCHTLGRVFSEYRSEDEWKLLKSTHLAMFPLADFQAFRGRRDRIENFESMTESEADDAFERMNQRPRNDRADRVLGEIAKRLPLFTDAWRAWTVDRREVPLAATWSVIGHEISRGDVRGTVTFTRVEEDEYETEWRLTYENGRQVVRRGRGIVYAGYSWRGRSETTAPREPAELREVLLLDEGWETLTGRIFTGDHNELGWDVSLYRRSEETRLFTADEAALKAPSSGNSVFLFGTGFPEDLAASDFTLGAGVTVTGARRGTNGHAVELTVDVAEGAELGGRMVSFRAVRGPRAIVLYDTIDYLKIIPAEGFSRIGGAIRPKQLERFEAVAYHRGPDKKPWTDDDFAIRRVDVEWALAEFPVRDGDDDLQFVGALDPATGVFTPGLDGPNPARRWDANNIGDVYVVATCTLAVPERIQVEQAKEEKKKEEEAESESGEEGGSAHAEGDGGDAPREPEEILGPPVAREFRARAHLLVTVPIYVDWDRYEWDRR